jgi:hypothetical protein
VRLAIALFVNAMPTNSIWRLHSSFFILCRDTSGYIAKTLSDTLTRETGIQITFESAIVPRWKNGTGAYAVRASIVHAHGKSRNHNRRKLTASYPLVCAGHIRLNKVRVVREEEEALRKNYASMDLTIQQIDVKLSLWWCVVPHFRVTHRSQSWPGSFF